MSPAPPAWSNPAVVEAKVRRRWDDGSLLTAYATGLPCPAIEVPLKGPKSSEIGDSVEVVRNWIARLETASRGGAHFALRWRQIGGRHFGRNLIPDRAVVDTFDQCWALLGVDADVGTFDEICTLTKPLPRVHDWVVATPHRALGLAGEWEGLINAYAWLDDHRDSGSYLREISAPGVDTKFAERHRTVLAALLGVPSTSIGFADGLGLRRKPELVRLRVSPELGLPRPVTELALRADELATLDLAPRSALVIENEITYLSVPIPEHGMVLWGKGFDVDRVGRLPWLQGVEVRYWGDIDTHGFGILDRLRAWLPQTKSVLMDRETLLAHQDRWVTEERPAAAHLRHLTSLEQDLYHDLVGDSFGQRVRLEQERIDWRWAGERLIGHPPVVA